MIYHHVDVDFMLNFSFSWLVAVELDDISFGNKVFYNLITIECKCHSSWLSLWLSLSDNENHYNNNHSDI